MKPLIKDLVSPKAYAFILKRFAGGQVYIPPTSAEYGKGLFATVMLENGFREDLDSLIRHRGGTRPYIPFEDSRSRALFEPVLRARNQGKSVREIARENNVSARWVYKLLAMAKEAQECK